MYKKTMAGSFIIELAIVLVFASGFLVLLINHMIAFNHKGRLDRAAYSLVTVISERKQLFDGQLGLCVVNDTCDSVALDAFNLAAASLKRMNGSFDRSKLGMQFDEISMTTFTDENGDLVSTLNPVITQRFGNSSGCDFPGVSDVSEQKAIELLPLTRVNLDFVRVPMYQVSLCYQIPLDLLGAPTGEFIHLVSTSFSFARF